MMTGMAPGTGVDGLRWLYQENAPALFRLGVALTGDPGVAEDLVHDAFLRFHAQSRPPERGHELAYLRRIVINLAHDHHRHLRVVRRTAVADACVAPSAEAGAVGADRSAAVAAAVDELPDRQRECVVLHYFAGLADAAIATELGISVGSVKTHLHRARANLASHLEEHR